MKIAPDADNLDEETSLDMVETTLVFAVDGEVLTTTCRIQFVRVSEQLKPLLERERERKKRKMLQENM